MNKDRVILVDENDRERGTGDKELVHVTGELHRAFSVFLIDAQGRHVIQRRALDKYHTAGLYSNACCSHPAPGETTSEAVRRRLMEELGMQCDVRPVLHMRYRCELENGLIEHEYDHVFVGTCSRTWTPNPDEVAEVAVLEEPELLTWMADDPTAFTPWFRLALPEVIQLLGNPGTIRSPRLDIQADGTVAAFLPVARRSDP
ncbi:MAG: isopentenyl-diphosphate Delta-isomerase [Rhodothermales bacterium]